MTPWLYACHFDRHGAGGFAQLAAALERSAARACPTWTRRVEGITTSRRRSAISTEAHVDNTQKLERWVEVVDEAPDGTPVALLDADTLIVNPIDDVWAEPFDLAYTTKPTSATQPYRFNLGVVFLRASPAVRAALHAWGDRTRELLDDRRGYYTWQRKYGGINQGAFGQLLADGAFAALTLRELPCALWNCEESAWPTFDPAVTRIVHVKGALRRAILGQGSIARSVAPTLAPLVVTWRAMARGPVPTGVSA